MTDNAITLRFLLVSKAVSVLLLKLYIVLVILLCLDCHNKISLTGWLMQNTVLFSSPEVWKSKIKVTAGVVYSGGSLPNLKTPGQANTNFLLRSGRLLY